MTKKLYWEEMSYLACGDWDINLKDSLTTICLRTECRIIEKSLEKHPELADKQYKRGKIQKIIHKIMGVRPTWLKEV